MNTIPTERLNQLMNCLDDPCITMVLSTQNAPFNRPLIQAQYQQLIHELKEQLAQLTLPALLQSKLLDKCEQLTLNANLWRHLDTSLIIYVSDQCLETVMSPTAYTNSVHISKRFSLKYSLPQLFEDLKFHVLSIQHHEVHLYSAFDHQLIEHCEEHFPQDILEVTQHKGLSYRTQGHSAGSQRGQSTGYVGYYSGAGESLDEAHQDLVRFYTALDHVLMDVLKHHTEPLLLVGDQNHMHLYKNISHYPNILSKILTTQNVPHNLKQLYGLASALMDHQIEDEKDKAIALIGEGEQKKHSRVRVKFNDIVEASHHANIESLLIWPDDIQKDNDDEDKVETLAREVYLNKGRLYTWVQTAAILRHLE